MTDHTHTEQKTDGNSNWRFNARCRKGGFFVSDRRNRTSITVKLQPEEFARLLAAMNTADSSGRTTPGAFLKRAALISVQRLLAWRIVSPTISSPS